jgi:hypothetical protein
VVHWNCVQRRYPLEELLVDEFMLLQAMLKKPYHYIKVNEGMYHDLMVWNLFLDKFNSIC